MQPEQERAGINGERDDHRAGDEHEQERVHHRAPRELGERAAMRRLTLREIP